MVAPGGDGVRIAVVGTNDVHGQLLPTEDRGGLVELSGYVAALRASGDADAVLLVDAGDMWQGTLESNLDEGASVTAAYEALGYAAAAIGNHEFDFGPAGRATPPAAARTAAPCVPAPPTPPSRCSRRTSSTKRAPAAGLGTTCARRSCSMWPGSTSASSA